MTSILRVLLLFVLLSQISCLIRAPEVLTPWEQVADFSTVTPYKNMKATANEVHLITDDEFVRLDNNGLLVTRQPLPLPFKFFGRPILGDFAMARIVRKSAQGNPVLELRTSNNPTVAFDTDFTTLDDMVDNPVLENIFPEEDSRYSGAFNANSTQLLIPSINFSKNVHTFFLIDINYNLGGSNGINGIEVSSIVDIPEIPAANGVLDNIKFINGNYYVVSLDGSFIIRPDGSYEKLFQGHFWDFFESDNKIFATERSRALYAGDMSGANWTIQTDSSSLQQVEVANGDIFSQQSIGFRFKYGSNDFLNPEEIVHNPEFPNDFAAYRNVCYLNGFYYMTVQKEVWRTSEIVLEEE